MSAIHADVPRDRLSAYLPLSSVRRPILRQLRVSAERRMLRIGGREFEEARAVRDLKAKDVTVTRYLVRQLIADQATGESTGLELVVKAFGPQLQTYIARLVDQDRDATQELFGEWLDRVIGRIGTFKESRSAFRTWLYQQAKYAAADWRRRQSRVPEPVDPTIGVEDVAFAAEVVEADDRADELLSIAEKGALNRALRRLRPAQRDLIWWRFVEGWTPTEIARIKLEGGVPANHVKVYVARAISRLANLYEQELGRD